MNSEYNTARPQWEIFCQVVDNYGDIGVCWRLARDLALRTGTAVRLWVDDWSALQRICPQASGLNDKAGGRVDGVELRRWNSTSCSAAEWNSAPTAVEPGAIVIEAFACTLPETHLQAMLGQHPRPLWINLEYLSAEPWVAACHGMASPHPRLGLLKHFFFPGFDGHTGGLLRESALLQRRDAFRNEPAGRKAWLARRGIALGDDDDETLCVSLFAYAQAGLPALLQAWSLGQRRLHLLVPEGRMLEAVCSALGSTLLPVGERLSRASLVVHALPFTDQDGYDELLWACDLNFVRGEDSFVRAQWAGRPFVWHIYSQDENAHRPKLEAFMSRYVAGLNLQTAAALKAFWQAWNGCGDTVEAWSDFAAALPTLRAHAEHWCSERAAQKDLVSALIAFCAHSQIASG